MKIVLHECDWCGARKPEDRLGAKHPEDWTDLLIPDYSEQQSTDAGLTWAVELCFCCRIAFRDAVRQASERRRREGLDKGT